MNVLILYKSFEFDVHICTLIMFLTGWTRDTDGNYFSYFNVNDC